VADRELPTKLEAIELSLAKLTPKEGFRFSGTTTVLATEHDLASESSFHRYDRRPQRLLSFVDRPCRYFDEISMKNAAIPQTGSNAPVHGPPLTK